MILKSEKKNPWALLPFIFFVGVFLASGILFDDFYALPAPVAVIIGGAVAFLLFYKEGTKQNIQSFVKGCGNAHIITMCLIVLLCGAFTLIMTELGAIELLAAVAQKHLSASYLYAGIFVFSSFLSFASGSSVGAISTVTPIVLGFVKLEGMDVALVAGSVLSGAMFGDNLSLTSDTTLVATQSQGVKMKDKFKMNAWIAFPSALLAIVILVFIGGSLGDVELVYAVSSKESLLKLLPYGVVIGLAVFGVNVLLALFAGIFLGVGIGWWQESWTLLVSVNYFYMGMLKMTDSLLVFMLTGGLAYLVEKEGGLNFLLFKMKRFMTTPLKAKIGIGAIVALLDGAIANNTVAIMVAAPIANRISHHFKIPSIQTASILDIISCVVQGIIPYGAQVLILLNLLEVKISYFELIAKVYYIWLLFVGAILYFLVFLPLKESKACLKE